MRAWWGRKVAVVFAGRALLGLCLLGFQLPGVAADAAEPAPAKPVLKHLALKSNAVLVVDEDTGETITAKNADLVAPIASVTKLMTALVVIDSRLPRDEILEVSDDDVDRYKHTPSRLKVGTRLRRDELLLLALMASENRAALALGRNYPGHRIAFVEQMNAKARALGMTHTHFVDPAGLSSLDVSSPSDLRLLLKAANAQPLIREYTTRPQYVVRVGKRNVTFINSNRLVRHSGRWDIEMQKTGYTNEAGRCLVMRARVAGRRLAMIFLNSFGKLTRYGDASRVRQRLEIEERRHGPREAAAFEATSSASATGMQ